MQPTLIEEQDWHEICYMFIETITDHLIFQRAVKIEMPTNYKTYFRNRNQLIKTPFEERVNLFLLKD